MLATGGLYAPTIRHHNGITYIICTNIIHGSSNLPGDERSEQFIIHTTDIHSGNWSDPFVFVFPGIDPSLFFEDGHVYVQLCKTGPEFQIYNLEIDIETGKMITEPTLIWKGWKKGYTEGPHIYKKDGWYYLLCAEGGTFRYHMLSMARSESIWGPYEHNEKNPLYTASGTDRYVQNTGHGDLFKDHTGTWWVVLLGVRMKEGRSILGRETFLTEVNWPDNEWPTIVPPLSDDSPGPQRLLLESRGSPMAPWVYLRNAKLDRYQIRNNNITLRADVVELTSPDESVAFVGQRQRRLHGAATVTLYDARPSTLLHAGLCLYKDEHRFLAIFYDFHLQQVVFRGLNRGKLFSRNESQSVLFEDTISFKIDYTETSLGFSFQADKGDWQSSSTLDTAILTDYDFTGPVIGVFGIGDDFEVKFHDFKIDTV
jgi:beta-xylosidase